MIKFVNALLNYSDCGSALSIEIAHNEVYTRIVARFEHLKRLVVIVDGWGDLQPRRGIDEVDCVLVAVSCCPACGGYVPKNDNGVWAHYVGTCQG